MEVGPADAARGDPQEHLSAGRRRDREVARDEGRPDAFQDDCTHALNVPANPPGKPIRPDGSFRGRFTESSSGPL
jgi:hypothetical protein